MKTNTNTQIQSMFTTAAHAFTRHVGLSQRAVNRLCETAIFKILPSIDSEISESMTTLPYPTARLLFAPLFEVQFKNAIVSELSHFLARTFEKLPTFALNSDLTIPNLFENRFDQNCFECLIESILPYYPAGINLSKIIEGLNNHQSTESILSVCDKIGIDVFSCSISDLVYYIDDCVSSDYCYGRLYRRVRNGDTISVKTLENSDMYIWLSTEELFAQKYDCIEMNGEWYSESFSEENFSSCSCCESLVWAESTDSDGRCEYCHRDEIDLLPYSSNVLEYCGRKFFQGQKTLKLHNKPKSLIFGLELEMLNGDGHYRELLRELETNEGESWILCQDGSVDAELKALPGDLESWQSERKDVWQVLKIARSERMQGHASKSDSPTGIHIHVDRRTVDILTIRKLEIVLNEIPFYNFCQLIAQRDYFDTGFAGYVEPKLSKTIQRGEKYAALNFRHEDTYEVRIFNSNLRKDRVLKNIEFLHSMLQYLKKISILELQESPRLVITKYLDFVSDNRKTYKNLGEFLGVKELTGELFDSLPRANKIPEEISQDIKSLEAELTAALAS